MPEATAVPEPRDSTTDAGRRSERRAGALRSDHTSDAPSRSEPIQAALPLRVGRGDGSTPLIPARILNEFVYCPRLAYLEWVQKEWEDSSDTVQGKYVHRKVDRQGGKLPKPDEQSSELKVARSVELSSTQLNLIAKIDLVESSGGKVVPLDYKRGKRPHVARQAYDPERVQLCAQGLLLREHGYECSEGILYFAGSRERVRLRRRWRWRGRGVRCSATRRCWPARRTWSRLNAGCARRTTRVSPQFAGNAEMRLATPTSTETRRLESASD